MWLCHLCKSPSGSHRMLGDHPWAFLSPGVSVPSSGCWTIVYPWAGLSPGSLLSRGRNLGTVFHQHQAEVGSDNRSWPGPLDPSSPNSSSGSLEYILLCLQIICNSKSIPVSGPLQQGCYSASHSQWLILPCTEHFTYWALWPSPAFPKSGFFSLYLLEDKSVTLI